jgi:FkbM family methyltransferase
MIRDLGLFTPRRPHKLNAPLMAMLLNGLHDRHKGRVFVLQVGAGTGETGLPLLQRFRDDGWSGLLVEPHPAHFARLEELHASSDRVAVLNLGISDISASLPLYSLTPEAEARGRRGPRGRASLIRDRIARPDAAEADVVATEVPFLRLDTVLRELGVDSAQLVAVNAGGHEAQVLRGFDLAAVAPSLVLVHSTAGTSGDQDAIAELTAAELLPFRIADWLVGLAPGRLSVPLEELLTFLQKGLGAPQDDEE